MASQREQDAQRHLDKALIAAGVNFTGICERRFDGYAVTFFKPSKRILLSGIDEAVLENDPSPELEQLIEDVQRQMGLGPDGAPSPTPGPVRRRSKVSPFHSKAVDAPKQYHDSPACPVGAQILRRHKVSGTGGYQQCPQCARLR